MMVPALVYVPKVRTGRMPAMITIPGHVYCEGKTAESVQARCANLALRGVFAMTYDYIDTGERNTGANACAGMPYGGGNDHGLKQFSYTSGLVRCDFSTALPWGDSHAIRSARHGRDRFGWGTHAQLGLVPGPALAGSMGPGYSSHRNGPRCRASGAAFWVAGSRAVCARRPLCRGARSAHYCFGHSA